MKSRRLAPVWLVGILGSLVLAGSVITGRSAQSERLVATAVQREVVEVDAQAPGRPFPHYWERMFGSERAIVTLRESYRRDLREVKEATGFEYVRFHAIFHDEVGVYDETA